MTMIEKAEKEISSGVSSRLPMAKSFRSLWGRGKKALKRLRPQPVRP
jgi:hypothetical protein